MRTKVNALPELVLTRVLEALGQELIDAPDEEITAAAKDLGMDPNMKGSAAFFGLTFPTKMNVSDLFDLDAIKHLMATQTRQRVPRGISTDPEPKTRRPIRSGISTGRKDPSQK